MTARKRIKGDPGTQPPVAPAIPPVAPPATDRIGQLVGERDHFYVRSGTLKIRLDNASVARLLATKRPTPHPGSRKTTGVPEELKAALDAAQKYRSQLMAKPGVLAVRAGYKFVNGAITDTPCVVVAVDRKREDLSRADLVPAVLPNGLPTDVTPADPYDRFAAGKEGPEAAPMVKRPRLLIEELQADASETEFLEALPMTTYEPPPEGNLEAVTDAMTVTCHVSPDAGWRVLEPFLQGTERKLHLGMYDFTAPHIFRTARSLLRDSDVEWQQVLDPKVSLPGENDADSNKADDLAEEQVTKGLRRVAKDRFGNVFARIGSGRTFASAYHIKVAVRDDQTFWLSSGNWQSSNQPAIDFLDEDADRKLIPRFNREWHVVVENATLAKRFQRFLDFDFDTASTEIEAAVLPPAALPDLLMPAEDFLAEERAAVDLDVFPPRKFVFTKGKPLTVQPILTPDNYVGIVLAFLKKKPKERLYFQNQSLNPVKDPSPEFEEMMKLLIRYSNDPNLDVRIIFRNIGPVRKKLESLKAAGFNMRRIRMQAGCHTKGIIVDSGTILLGSHNFTNQGIQVNRDASLLIQHDGIAKYFEKVFLHDWEKLSRATINEEAVPMPVGAGAEAALLSADPADVVRLPWSYYEEE